MGMYVEGDARRSPLTSLEGQQGTDIVEPRPGARLFVQNPAYLFTS